MADAVEIERLYVTLEAQNKQYMSGIREVVQYTSQAANQLSRHAKEAEVFGRTINGLGTWMSAFAGSMVAMAALQSPFQTLIQSIGLAGEAERVEADFATMLGSAEKAAEMVKELKDFAAVTPLTMPGIKTAMQMLMQYGIVNEHIIDTIRTIGDVAGGEEGKLLQIARQYGQAFSRNKLQTEEWGICVEAGFNPMQELMQLTGKTDKEIMRLREHGEITGPMMAEAFKLATAEGGRFHDRMKAAGKMLPGLMSTMSDDIDTAKAPLGRAVTDGLNLREKIKWVSKAAQEATKQIDGMSPGLKTAAAYAAAAAGAFGSLIVGWKLVALGGGIVVVVMTDVAITTTWLTRSTGRSSRRPAPRRWSSRRPPPSRPGRRP